MGYTHLLDLLWSSPGLQITWEELFLSDVFSKSEALRTVFKLPVLLERIEVIKSTAGTHLKPHQKEWENVLVIAFAGLWLLTALWEAACGV